MFVIKLTVDQVPSSVKATAPAFQFRLADGSLSVKIAIWKNHENKLSVDGTKWLNEAVVISSLKVTGGGTEDNTELSTTNGSRLWAAPKALAEALLSRAVKREEIISMSKSYEGGAPPDYSVIEGQPLHLSTLSSMLVPNVWVSV